MNGNQKGSYIGIMVFLFISVISSGSIMLYVRDEVAYRDNIPFGIMQRNVEDAFKVSL